MTEPIGADVMYRAKEAMHCVGMTGLCTDPVYVCPCKHVARALQQYGDERAREAIEPLIVDRDKWAALPVSSPCRLTVLNQLNWSIDAIRALAAKPGSET